MLTRSGRLVAWLVFLEIGLVAPLQSAARPDSDGVGANTRSGPASTRSQPIEESTPGRARDDTRVNKCPRRIKIATIGSLPSAVAADATHDAIVAHVLRHWHGRFAQVLPDEPDLIVVPENCDRPSGFARERQFAYYRDRGDRVRDEFAKIAAENNCYITYPATRAMADGTWRNSIVLLDRKGGIAGIYDKNHPTIGEIEAGILPGTETPVIECDFGRVALAICFDLNFDVLRARYARKDPDLILFCSMYHGGLMQSYWAYSCRSHFVGAIERRCRSEIRDPLGNVVASNTNYFDYVVAEVNLDHALVHLDYHWDRLKDLKKKYGPAVTITDPGHLGAVMVASSHPKITASGMLDEFQIERLTDYLDRSLQIREKGVRTLCLPTLEEKPQANKES